MRNMRPKLKFEKDYTTSITNLAILTGREVQITVGGGRVERCV
jgi:hypothetical protein